MLGAAVASVVLAVVVFRNLKREFVPPEDRGLFITILIAPEGSTLAFTDQYQRQVEAILAQDAGRRSLLQRRGRLRPVRRAAA